MNAQSILSIMIQAKDQASGVLKQVGGNIDNLKDKSFNLARNGFNKVQEAGKTMVTGLMIGIPLLAGMVGGLGVKSVQAQANFETMGISLKTALGGNVELAKQAQKELSKFADDTPYEVDEVTRAFIKLKNMGLDPSNKALTAYGDTASAMGKSLNDMVEAVADAATGEFERLKEFGIRSSSEGDKVTFTFKGVSTTVKKESKAIEGYLIKLGQVNFGGGMADQAKSLTGLFSTLSSKVKTKMAEIAEALGANEAVKGVFTSIIKELDAFDVSTNIDKAIKSFEDLKQKAKELYNQFTGTPIYAEIKKIIKPVQELWDSLDKAEATKALLIGLAGAIATILIPTIGLMVGGALLAAAPFILLAGAIGGLFYLFETNPAVKEFLTNVWDRLVVAFNDFKDNILPQIQIKLKEFADYWGTTVQPKLTEFLGGAWSQIIKDFKYFKDEILPLIKTKFDEFKKSLDESKPTFDMINGVVQFLADLFMLQAYPALKDMVTALKELWDVLSPYVIPALKIVAFIIGFVLAAVFVALVFIIKGVATAITDWANGFKENIERGQKAIEGFKKGFEMFGEAGKAIFKGTANAIIELVNRIVNAWKDVARNVKDIPGLSMVADLVLKIPELPKFANGGVVGGNSYTGDKILARVNSGELILNQDQQNRLLNSSNSSGNTTIQMGDINIGYYTGTEKDKRRVADELGDAIEIMLRKRKLI